MAKKAATKNNQVVKYTVEGYLTILRAGGLSEFTIEGYRKVLLSFAKFLNVPLDEIHNHLSASNLLKYADSRKGKSAAGTRTNLSIIHRYMAINGIVFDPLEYKAVKPKVTPEQNDKPLELVTLQKMMDLADSHGKAIISFLISTGCRAGETAEILLSDVDGDIVTIRNEIAKGGKGGKVYLTTEAREFLDLWLKDRDRYIEMTDIQHKALVKGGYSKPRQGKDQRLFGCSYASLNLIFSRLYKKVDGEQGKYHSKITTHSTRKYFRTHAVKTMPLDLVEKIMRHTGYLTSEYVRITDEQAREQFHAGEHALLITRADSRIQGTALDTLKRENKELRELLKEKAEQATVMKQLDILKADMEKMKASIK